MTTNSQEEEKVIVVVAAAVDNCFILNTHQTLPRKWQISFVAREA